MGRFSWLGREARSRKQESRSKKFRLFLGTSLNRRWYRGKVRKGRDNDGAQRCTESTEFTEGRGDDENWPQMNTNEHESGMGEEDDMTQRCTENTDFTERSG